jgi:Domain of unknown function (DUF2017)
MARRFERTRRGLTARFDDGERALLTELLGEVAELLDDGRPAETDPLEALVAISEDARRPTDPALARLLPDAARDDPRAAAEFRRFTERGLRQRKREALTTALASLERPGPLRLDAAEAQAWLTALNDVRLVVAERLELRTEDDAERLLAQADETAAGDPRGWLAAVYDFLTWLQETLVGALTEEMRHRPAPGSGL